MAKHDTRTMPVRILEALDKGDVDGDGLTAIAIGAYISVRPNTVTAELKIMTVCGDVSRSGAGKRGDPYLFHHAENRAEKVLVERELADQKMTDDPCGVEKRRSAVRGDETAGNGATASPVAADRSEADTKASPQRSFGEYFGELRRQHGVTLREFCKENDFDPGNLSKVERGLMQPPKSDRVVRLANCLGLADDAEETATLLDLASFGRVESEDGDTSGADDAVAAELSKCYEAVIDDVTARALRVTTDAKALLDDAKVMTAAATLLMRILEGETDR